MPESGVRLSIWLGKEDTWMIKVMQRLRRHAEDKGIPVTQGALIRIALESYLRHRSTEEDFE